MLVSTKRNQNVHVFTFRKVWLKFRTLFLLTLCLFLAGRTTYVGLWPIYFPDIRYVNGGWSTNLVVRNNSTRTAQIRTTFFSINGHVHHQRTDTIAPNAIVIIASPTTLITGSALVVGTENIVAVAKHSHPSGLANLDNGIRPQGYGDSNFDTANGILYVPAFYNNIFGGFNSNIYLQNTETALIALHSYALHTEVLEMAAVRFPIYEQVMRSIQFA